MTSTVVALADHIAPELFKGLGVGVGVAHEHAGSFAAVEQLANRSADGVGPGADDHLDLTGLRRPLTHSTSLVVRWPPLPRPHWSSAAAHSPMTRRPYLPRKNSSGPASCGVPRSRTRPTTMMWSPPSYSAQNSQSR